MKLEQFVSDKLCADHWELIPLDLFTASAVELLEPSRKAIEDRLDHYTEDLPWTRFRDTLWLLYVDYNPDVRPKMKELLGGVTSVYKHQDEVVKPMVSEKARLAKEVYLSIGKPEQVVAFISPEQQLKEEQECNAHHAKLQETHTQAVPRIDIWELINIVSRHGWDGPRSEECQAMQEAAMKPHFSSTVLFEIIDGTWVIHFVADEIDHDRHIELHVYPDGHCTIIRNQELASSVRESRTISF